MTALSNSFKTIQTFGCSLTAGDDMVDVSKIWPSQLARKISSKLENYSYSNASNQSIADKVVEKLNPKSLVIVCWTSQFRHQIYQDNTKIDYNILQYKDNKVIAENETLKPMSKNLIKMSELQKMYVNEEQYYKSFLQTVLWLQQYLKFKQVKYIFCYGNSMSVSFAKKLWNVKPQIETNLYHPYYLRKKFSFISAIDTKYFVDFNKPNKSFWETCVIKNYPLGPQRHPLIDGHSYWANYLYKSVAKSFNI